MAKRPCENGMRCKYEEFDYSHNMLICGIDFDGDACPYVKPWGKRKWEQDHKYNEEWEE